MFAYCTPMRGSAKFNVLKNVDRDCIKCLNVHRKFMFANPNIGLGVGSTLLKHFC